MTDHIIKAALEADFSEHDIRGIEGPKFAAFYAIAFAAGMERAAEICESLPADYYGANGECADAIRAEAHAQNQPKNEHDTDDM